MPVNVPAAAYDLTTELSDILERAHPSDHASQRVIVFEYLPRYTSAGHWAHKWADPGDILAIFRRHDYSLLQNLILGLTQAAGGSCYIFSTWLTGWAHAQLVVFEQTSGGATFRGTIFGGTKNEGSTDRSDGNRKVNVPHPKHGADWKKIDGAEHQFAGYTTMNNAEIIEEANLTLEHWKRRGIRYGLTYYNCERFCQDLAAKICTLESRRRFLFEKHGEIGQERIAGLERYAEIDNSPGHLYYRSRTATTQQRVYAPWGKPMVRLIMVLFTLTLIAWRMGIVVENFDKFAWGWVFVIVGLGSLRVCLTSVEAYLSYSPIFGVFQISPSHKLRHKHWQKKLRREYGLHLRRPLHWYNANDRPLFYFYFPFSLVVGTWFIVLGSRWVYDQLKTLHWD